MPRTEVTGSQIKDSTVDLAVDVTGVLPVANGGSGSTTIALNNVVLGNGSGAVQTVAPGANNNVLRSNGTTWVSGALPVAGQPYDLSVVAFSAATVRVAGTGDFPFGVRLARAVTFTQVTYRAATADASGNLVVELRKNGVAVSGSSATIAAASQVGGGTATGSWAFSAGDIITVQITGVGTTPGRGLIADLAGLTT